MSFQNKLKSFCCSLGISYKLWLMAGIMIGLILVIALMSIQSLSRAENQINTVVEEVQPILLASMDLGDTLKATNAALGFYMLSQDTDEKKAYEQYIEQLHGHIFKLKQFERINNNDVTSQLVQEIDNDVKAYQQYHDQMLVLANDELKNVPGVAYSGQYIRPISQRVLQLLTQSILSEEEEEASDERKVLLNHLHNLRYTWTTMMVNVRQYLMFRGQTALDTITVNYEVTGKILQKILVMQDSLNLDQEDAITNIKVDREEFYKHFQELKSIHNSDKWRVDSYLLRTEIGPLVKDITAKINKLIDIQRNESTQSSTDLVTQVTSIKQILIGLLIVGIICGVGGAMLMGYLITKPIKNAAIAMRDISEGEGDLTCRLEVFGNDETAQQSQAFNKFIQVVHNIISRVADSTLRISSASCQMSDITSVTRKNMVQEKRDAEQLSTAMLDMVKTVQDVENNARSASEAANEADIYATEGRKVVSETISVIKTLATEVDDTSNVIEQLEKDSNQVGTVLEVIQAIAEQTNLLALNAAIEAARAGEQGRGFAVVADEVRSLASRTHKSTKEIQGIIESVQSGARNAVNVMEHSRSRVSLSVEKVTDAGGALEKITNSVAQINKMNSHIAAAAQQQSDVAASIHKNILNITQVVEQTVVSTEELATTSDELAQLASTLEGQVDKFKI